MRDIPYTLAEGRHDRALVAACRPDKGPVTAHCETCDAPTVLRHEDPYHVDFGLCLWCKGYDITLKVPLEHRRRYVMMTDRPEDKTAEPLTPEEVERLRAQLPGSRWLATIDQQATRIAKLERKLAEAWEEGWHAGGNYCSDCPDEPVVHYDDNPYGDPDGD